VTSANNRLIYLERVKGIEPSSKAWEVYQGTCEIKELELKHLREKGFLLPMLPIHYHCLPCPVSQIVPDSRSSCAT
jgi:hypothetical protein